MCSKGGAFLASIPPRTDVGPIQALIDELEFNQAIAARAEEVTQLGASAHFSLVQFERCISEGILSLLQVELKQRLIAAYASMKRANSQMDTIPHARSGDPYSHAVDNTRARLTETQPLIESALLQLRAVLAPS